MCWLWSLLMLLSMKARLAFHFIFLMQLKDGGLLKSFGQFTSGRRLEEIQEYSGGKGAPEVTAVSCWGGQSAVTHMAWSQDTHRLAGQQERGIYSPCWDSVCTESIVKTERTVRLKLYWINFSKMLFILALSFPFTSSFFFFFQISIEFYFENNTRCTATYLLINEISTRK